MLDAPLMSRLKTFLPTGWVAHPRKVLTLRGQYYIPAKCLAGFHPSKKWTQRECPCSKIMPAGSPVIRSASPVIFKFHYVTVFLLFPSGKWSNLFPVKFSKTIGSLGQDVAEGLVICETKPWGNNIKSSNGCSSARNRFALHAFHNPRGFFFFSQYDVQPRATSK